MTDSERPLVNLADVDLQDLTSPKESFQAKLARLGPILGADKLGVMFTIIEPGKRAFPFHAHHAIEEMFFIVDGSGTYRLGDQFYPIRAGDLIAAPAGGAKSAHQIINTGAERLAFLAISTMDPVDIVEYPDSGKVRLFAHGASETLQEARLNHVTRFGDAVEFYEGEEV